MSSNQRNNYVNGSMWKQDGCGAVETVQITWEMEELISEVLADSFHYSVIFLWFCQCFYGRRILKLKIKNNLNNYRNQDCLSCQKWRPSDWCLHCGILVGPEGWGEGGEEDLSDHPPQAVSWLRLCSFKMLKFLKRVYSSHLSVNCFPFS